MLAVIFSGANGLAQESRNPATEAAVVDGTLKDAAGDPIAGASIFLLEKGPSPIQQTTTKPDGAFALAPVHAGTYLLRAEKAGFSGTLVEKVVLLSAEKKHLSLRLQRDSTGSPPAGSPAGEMEFDDKPSFTIAGVTDTTAAGGHGSGEGLRTSEALAAETLTLKSGVSSVSLAAPTIATSSGQQGPGDESEGQLRTKLARSPHSFEANRRLGDLLLHSGRSSEAVPLLAFAATLNPDDRDAAHDLAQAYKDSGELPEARDQLKKVLAQPGRSRASQAEAHLWLGETYEQLDDPVAAVKEYEMATRLEPNEPSYFEWGAELLLHRAILPAVEVFGNGVRAHPQSARMLAGLGVALYASGSAENAAQTLCHAADLDPLDAQLYYFLGKMQMAYVSPLPCVEQKLARLVRDQPGNALGNYYYAVAIWKGPVDEDPRRWKLSLSHLEKATTIDPTLGTAYLQIAVMYSARGDDERTVQSLNQAIAVSPDLAEAHYRLATTYKHMGESSKAQQEMQIYKQAEKTEAAERDRKHRELQQFVVMLKGPQGKASPH